MEAGNLPSSTPRRPIHCGKMELFKVVRVEMMEQLQSAKTLITRPTQFRQNPKIVTHGEKWLQLATPCLSQSNPPPFGREKLKKPTRVGPAGGDF